MLKVAVVITIVLLAGNTHAEFWGDFIENENLEPLLDAEVAEESWNEDHEHDV